ncbi:MAG: cob(I)yrinic acid a,c-diamide adenosyltransferase [Candidatus Xenobia bacterium]
MARPRSKISITRVYTRTGDKGTTALVDGQRVGKDALRIEAFGTVDELNAAIGVARAELTPPVQRLEPLLRAVQSELFDVGAELATPPEALQTGMPVASAERVTAMEQVMDRLNLDLPPLRSFVLPAGSRLAAALHVARTVCRRAERVVVHLARSETVRPEVLRYLNRLSDLLFVLARWVVYQCGQEEMLWEPHGARSYEQE